jgi:acyl-ACP thioesterase
MVIIEVVDSKGTFVGLYMADNDETVAEVTEKIKNAYEYAQVKKQHHLESNYEEEIDVKEEAEDHLRLSNIECVESNKVVVNKD